MLFDDSEQLEVRHVISLTHYDIDIYAGGDPIPEGELWIKRNCIRLAQRDTENLTDTKSFFLFSDNCSEKEDFYHAIVQSQKCHAEAGSNLPSPLKFRTPDLVKLVQQLHASEENLHTRWINALIGRLFLALYKTQDIENLIWTKITKKIARVPKPALISGVNVHKIDMGNLPPLITNPKLKELTVDGDLTIEADVTYKGNFRLEVSAVARIELGSRIKAREVNLVLATILKRLEGRILVRIKPPPSNRIWVTFETAPKMEFSLEPIVSSRQITYGVILRAIENRIREVVVETLVFPNWDDVPFSDTTPQEFRGGIWETTGSNAHLQDIELNSMTKDSWSTEPEPDPEASLDVSDSIQADDATKSMPTLRRAYADDEKARGPVQTKPDATESIGASSATDIRSNAKPRAMRSGSFSHAASPIVDVKPVNALALTPSNDEQKRNHDAASTMRNTIIRSPPTSPGQLSLGSPQQSETTLPMDIEFSPAAMAIDKSGNSPDPSPPNKEPTLWSQSTFPDHESSRPSSNHSQASSHLSKRTTNSLGRQPMLNNSFNAATAAARKWLGSRQTLGSPSKFNNDASDSKTPSTCAGQDDRGSSLSIGKSTSSPSSPANPVTKSENSHRLGPIGRGQPLPPPGTPLPPPSQPGKRSTWSVPTTSAFASLTRRKTLSTKLSTQLLNASVNDQHVAAGATDMKTGNIGQDNGEKQGRSKSSSTSSLSSTPPLETPPPLPKRRQRLSEPTPSNSHVDKEEVLVVEAPDQELSRPTSPAELDENEDVPQLQDLKENEGSFTQTTELDQGVG